MAEAVEPRWIAHLACRDGRIRLSQGFLLGGCKEPDPAVAGNNSGAEVPSSDSSGIEHLECFAGVATVSCQMALLGVPTSVVVESDHAAQTALAHLLPRATLFNSYEEWERQWPSQREELPNDVIRVATAGPPCVAIAAPGKQQFHRHHTARYLLSSVDFMRQASVQVMVIENVPLLAREDKEFGTGVGKHSLLAELVAYAAKWGIVVARTDFLSDPSAGGATTRERFFLFLEQSRAAQVLPPMQGCGSSKAPGTIRQFLLPESQVEGKAIGRPYVASQQTIVGKAGAKIKGQLLIRPPIRPGMQVALRRPTDDALATGWTHVNCTTTWYGVEAITPDGRLVLVDGPLVLATDVRMVSGEVEDLVGPDDEVILSQGHPSARTNRWIIQQCDRDKLLVISSDAKQSLKFWTKRRQVVAVIVHSLPVYDIDGLATTLRTWGDRFHGAVVVFDDRLAPPRPRALQGEEMWRLTGLPETTARHLLTSGFSQADLQRLAANAITRAMAEAVAPMLQRRGWQHSLIREQYTTGVPWLAPDAPKQPTKDIRVLATVFSTADEGDTFVTLVSKDRNMLVGSDCETKGRFHKGGKLLVHKWVTHLTGLPPDEVFLASQHTTEVVGGTLDTHVFGTVVPIEVANNIAAPTMRWVPQQDIEPALRLPIQASYELIRSFQPSMLLAPTIGVKAPRDGLRRLLDDIADSSGILAPAPALPGLQLQDKGGNDWTRILDAQDDLVRQLGAQLEGTSDPGLHVWASKLKPVQRCDLHPDLASQVLQNPVQGLQTTLVINRCFAVPTTPCVPTSREPERLGGFSPESWEDLYLETPLAAIKKALEALAKGAKVRLVITQEDMVPEARGIVWDCRGQRPRPMTFGEGRASHLNTEWIVQQLRDTGWVDEALISALQVGVTYQATDLEQSLQTRVMGNLASLRQHEQRVFDEFKHLQVTYGWFETFTTPPFVPFQLIPRGATPKPSGDIRPTTDAGAPRKPMRNTSGVKLPLQATVSLNDAAKCTDEPFPEVPDEWMHPGELGPKVQVVPAARDSFPQENKPRVEDVGTFLAATKNLQLSTNATIVAAGVDLTKFFNQLMTHPSQWWMTLASYYAHGELHFVTEYVMTFGLFPASNLAQRFINAILHLFCVYLDKADAAVVPYHCQENSDLAAWCRERTKLSAEVTALHHLFRQFRREAPASSFKKWLAIYSRRQSSNLDSDTLRTYRALKYIETPWLYAPQQARLWHIAAYTDDIHLSMLTVANTPQRALKVLNEVLERCQLLVAVPKHQLGVQTVWIGAGLLSGLAVAYITPKKRLKATTLLAKVLRGVAVHSEYQVLLAFLEHLCFLNAHDRSIMAQLWRWFNHDNDPAKVLGYPPEYALSSLRKWWNLLHGVAGASMLSRRSVHIMPEQQPVIVASSDAAIEGAGKAGIGVYCHGYFSRYVLTPRERALPIAVLEAAGAVAMFLVVARLLGVEGPGSPPSTERRTYGKLPPVLLRVDAISTPQVFTTSTPKATMMVELHALLSNTMEYKAMAPVTWFAHVHGEKNSMADAVSRSELHRLRGLCAAIGVTPTEVPFPLEVSQSLQSLTDLLQPTVARPLTAEEQQLTQAHSSYQGNSASYVSSRANKDPKRKPKLSPGKTIWLSTPQQSQPLVRAAGGCLLPDSRIGRRTHPTTQKHALRDKIAAQHRLTHVAKQRLRPQATRPSDMDVAADERADMAADVVLQVRQRGTQFGLNPSEPGLLEGLMALASSLSKLGRNPNTAATHASHWKRWVRVCELMGTSPWRADFDANSGRDQVGYHNEVVLLSAAYLFAMTDMKGRKQGARGVPLPASGRSFLQSIRAIHKAQSPSIEMVPLAAVAGLFKGLMHRHAALYGVDSLIPRQARPFRRSHLLIMLDTPEGTQLSPRLRVVRASLWWHSWRVYVTLSSQTGLRKSEVALPAGGTWSSNRISRASCSWIFRGAIKPWLSTTELVSLSEADFLIVKPPPSKADPFSLVWGSRPIYIPVRLRDPLNAAVAVRDLFLKFPVAPDKFKETPLLQRDDTKPFGCSFVDATLRQLLLLQMDMDDASAYTPHSFRVYLATTLRAAGASDTQIQALCRWQSLESLRLYALIDSTHYADLLDKAARTTHTALRSHNIPDIPLPPIGLSVDEANLTSATASDSALADAYSNQFANDWALEDREVTLEAQQDQEEETLPPSQTTESP